MFGFTNTTSSFAYFEANFKTFWILQWPLNRNLRVKSSLLKLILHQVNSLPNFTQSLRTLDLWSFNTKRKCKRSHWCSAYSFQEQDLRWMIFQLQVCIKEFSLLWIQESHPLHWCLVVSCICWLKDLKDWSPFLQE